MKNKWTIDIQPRTHLDGKRFYYVVGYLNHDPERKTYWFNRFKTLRAARNYTKTFNPDTTLHAPF